MQNIPFNGGICLGDFEGQIFVATQKQILKLLPISWEKQVNALMENRGVSEALQLAETAHKTGYTKENFLKVFHFWFFNLSLENISNLI